MIIIMCVYCVYIIYTKPIQLLMMYYLYFDRNEFLLEYFLFFSNMYTVNITHESVYILFKQKISMTTIGCKK